MKLSDTIERVYFSAYFELQNSISFFLLVTESQSYVHSAQPCNNFELFSHFYYSITQNIFELCIYTTSRYYRGGICLCIFKISDLYLFFLVSHMILKLGSWRAQFWAIFSFSLLHNSKHTWVSCLHMKHEVYETFSDYSGGVCLYIVWNSDLNLFFLVSHMISKLGSGHESWNPQLWDSQDRKLEMKVWDFNYTGT